METNNIIKKLLNRKQNLLEELKKIDTVIENLQDLCEHEFKYVGSDSHKDYCVCIKCGFEEAL
jgi:hypothetical protein